VYQPPHKDLHNHAVIHSEKEIAREIHHRAHEAWTCVRTEYPRKLFSAEFRDGFLDGYSDYLDRGGAGQPPAVPPQRYTQNKKYYTPEGHALLRDYFLGFQYGTDVAIATGQRQYLTVPVLIPDDGTPVSTEPATAVPAPLPKPPAVPPSDAPVKPVPQPLPVPRPMSKLPTPRRLPTEPAPNATSTPVDLESSKFLPIPVHPGLVPPLPSSDPLVPPLPSIPKLPMSSAKDEGDVLPAGAKLPAPPKEVPTLPDDVPLPPYTGEVPELNLPVNHPEPVHKESGAGSQDSGTKPAK
jgi:hypothetical protein